jgi:hypothetical protein
VTATALLCLAAAATGAAVITRPRARLDRLDRLGRLGHGRPVRAPRPRAPLHRSPVALRCGCLLTGVLLTTAGLGVAGVVVGLVLAAVLPGVVARSEPPEVAAVRREIAAGLPLAADLLSAALRGGAEPGWALERVGSAVGGALGDRLLVAARALTLGADPGAAWQPALAAGGEVLGPLADAFAAAWTDGSALSDRVELVAGQAREAAAATALTGAERAGVRAVAPLGLCFLPAFVAVGVVPVVAAALAHLAL